MLDMSAGWMADDDYNYRRNRCDCGEVSTSPTYRLVGDRCIISSDHFQDMKTSGFYPNEISDEGLKYARGISIKEKSWWSGVRYIENDSIILKENLHECLVMDKYYYRDVLGKDLEKIDYTEKQRIMHLIYPLHKDFSEVL